MTAPPDANTQYSRGSEPLSSRFPPLRRSVPRPRSHSREGAPALATTVVAAALVGALLVLVAQFTALYHLRSATSSAPIRTVGTGASHAWSPLPLALLAAALAIAVHRDEDRTARARTALAAIAVLGIVILGIALLGDLADARASGLIESSASHYLPATSSPSAGLYMETLGAVVLVISGGVGVLMPVGRHPDIAD